MEWREMQGKGDAWGCKEGSHGMEGDAREGGCMGVQRGITWKGERFKGRGMNGRCKKGSHGKGGDARGGGFIGGAKRYGWVGSAEGK